MIHVYYIVYLKFAKIVNQTVSTHTHTPHKVCEVMDVLINLQILIGLREWIAKFFGIVFYLGK